VYFPAKIRSDYGSETYDLCAVQTAIHQLHGGDPSSCYSYGKSIRNQKIECLWSQFIRQFEQRWRDIFKSIEHNDHWNIEYQTDRAALLYIYMPILREEINVFRQQYNSHSIRKNNLSRLPYGPPEDNFFLASSRGSRDFSLPVPVSSTHTLRQEMIPNHDCDSYLPPPTLEVCDRIIRDSPQGEVAIHNALEQYLYLRSELIHGGYEQEFPLLFPPKNKFWARLQLE
jgi:hypothetical protein